MLIPSDSIAAPEGADRLKRLRADEITRRFDTGARNILSTKLLFVDAMASIVVDPKMPEDLRNLLGRNNSVSAVGLNPPSPASR